MIPEVKQLAAAIDAVATLDPDALTDTELDQAMIVLQQQRARLGAVTARLLARWDSRKVWAGDQSRSAATRLVRDTNCSITTARVELRRARQLQAMPVTHAAVSSGVLSLDHVDLLSRANQPWRHTVFADHEPTLVAECAKLRFAQAQRMVDYWCQRADADADAAETDATRLRDRAHLHASPTLDGTVVVNGVLDPVGGNIVVSELARLERDLYLSDERDGVVRTGSQRRAAALVEMATRSAGAKEKRPRPLFSVLLGDDSFARMCELANGQVITPGTLVPWLGTADLETILFDGPSTVISVSKKRRFTGALRRAIQVRDRHCQHPSGCDEPADRCDVDHTVPVAENGPTDQFHGRIQCWPHNRDATKHDHGAIPLPPRPVTVLDELRARLRWRILHGYYDNPDNDPDEQAG